MRMLRGPLVALAAILPAGSAAAQEKPILQFHLSADPNDAIVIVEVDNRSGGELCAYRASANEARPELGLLLRSVRHIPLKFYSPGYIPEPIPDLRIPQGRSLLDRFRLADYFPHFRNRHAIQPHRWEARPYFRFHRCGHDDWQMAESEWEPL
jgi:hypothetical protein